MEFKSNKIIKYSALTIILIFANLVLSQSTPNKAYKFLITTRYSGDDVLTQNTEIEISENGTILWNSPVYLGSIPLRADIDAFSKKFDVITINFNIRGNIYGHKGTLIINLTQKQLVFSEPSLVHNSRQRIGFYDLEILETDKERNERYKTEDKKLYASINQAIANNEYLKAKMFVDKLNLRNEFPNLNEFNKLQEQKINNQKLEQDKVIFYEVNRLLKLDDLINANSKLQEINFQNNIIFEQLKSELKSKEKNRFTNIDDLAKNQKFKEAFDLYKTLLNPGEYIFDKSSWSTIKEKILIDNYRTLNEGFKTKNLKDFIQVYLEEKNKSRIEDLNNEEIRLFIEKNKDALSKLTIGNYKVRISPNGNIYINEVLPNDYYELVKKYIDLYNEFKVEVNSQFILILTEVTSPQYTSPKKWVLNDKYKDKILFSKNSFAVISDKDISPINNLKSFKYVDRDRDSEIKGNKYYLSSNEKIAYQTDFPKNKMGLYIPQSTTKYANSLSVSSITDYKFDRYIKLKKARSKKIIKNVAIISSVAFCTSWLVMRYKERHTANQY